MDRSQRNEIRSLIADVLAGDAASVLDVATIDHEDLLKALEGTPSPLVLTRAGAVRLLRIFLENSCTPAQAQMWASFVRRGYVSGRSCGPIRPLKFEYDKSCEDDIAAAVSRLDEIGDAIDGDVSYGELLDLLQLLGEA